MKQGSKRTNWATARRWRGMLLVTGLFLGAASGGVLTGCSSFNDARGRGDAPVGPQDRQPAEVVMFPDEFGNVAVKCDGHGHRLYVVTHNKTDAAVTVVTDRTCPGGGSS